MASKIFTIAILLLAVAGCGDVYKNFIHIEGKTYSLDTSRGMIFIYSKDEYKYLEWGKDTLFIKTYYNKIDRVDTVKITNQ